jgi:hypothetical protein
MSRAALARIHRADRRVGRVVTHGCPSEQGRFGLVEGPGQSGRRASVRCEHLMTSAVCQSASTSRIWCRARVCMGGRRRAGGAVRVADDRSGLHDRAGVRAEQAGRRVRIHEDPRLPPAVGYLRPDRSGRVLPAARRRAMPATDTSTPDATVQRAHRRPAPLPEHPDQVRRERRLAAQHLPCIRSIPRSVIALAKCSSGTGLRLRWLDGRCSWPEADADRVGPGALLPDDREAPRRARGGPCDAAIGGNLDFRPERAGSGDPAGVYPGLVGCGAG